MFAKTVVYVVLIQMGTTVSVKMDSLDQSNSIRKKKILNRNKIFFLDVKHL